MGQDHAITPHSLPTGGTPSNIKISNSRATKEKVATWPGELSLARPPTTRNHSDSTIKAPVPQEQTISLPVSATTSSTSSLPSFAS